MKKFSISIFLLFFTFGASSIAVALPISTEIGVDYVLAGDFRPANPDNLIVNVNISSDTTSKVATWTVDINSPFHEDIKLDSYYFNLALPVGVTVSFSNFSPTNSGMQWGSVGGGNAAGSGSADFDFGIGLTGNGNPNDNKVDNDTNLLFDVSLSDGLWTSDIITNAGLSNGGGIPVPGTQMGAHLQSLLATGSESDSGFASASAVNPIPEPATMLLFGSGLIVMAGIGRKKFKK